MPENSKLIRKKKVIIPIEKRTRFGWSTSQAQTPRGECAAFAKPASGDELCAVGIGLGITVVRRARLRPAMRTR